MTTIYLNGEVRELEDNATLLSLIEALGLAGKRIAVELNREIVPRSEHGRTKLSGGDKVEIVGAVGGG